MTARLDLLTVGESFEDVVFAGLPRLPRLGEELHVATLSRHAGGGAIITAVAAARLGLDVRTMTAATADVVARLRAEHVSLDNLRRPAERGAVSVALSTRRDRAFVTFDGVNRVLEPRLLKATTGLRALPRHVHFALGPRHCRRWVPVVQRLRSHGVTTSWDFGWNEPLASDAALTGLFAAVDWIFVNEREATLYARTRSLEAALRRWRDLARGTVVKMGPRGAIALIGGDRVQRPAPGVVVHDTTGAGDAFNAGFIAALLADAAVEDRLRMGNHIGAQSTRAAGGIDGLPRHDDLPAWARRLLEAR